MFKKFHVPTSEAKPRHTMPVKSGIIDWSSGCIGCLTCVKKSCPQLAYDQRVVDPVTLQDNLDSICADCYRCVQSCPQRLIHKTINPEFRHLGDEYFSPTIIAATWAQATTGKIPVSGSGYGGPFSGPGFDAMWTDMSEIVRPTRDGIHGREYISTSIQLGRRHLHLTFNENGGLTTPPLPVHELQAPILFQLPRGLEFGDSVLEGVARAAAGISGLFLAEEAQLEKLTSLDPGLAPNLVPVGEQLPSTKAKVMVLSGPAATPENVAPTLKAHPEAVIGFCLEMDADSPNRAVEMVRAGAGLIIFQADYKGRTKEDKFIKEAIRDIHLALVERTLRDQVTLLISGGLAMAEHLAKIIICGADGVVVDWPLLVALECRFCEECTPQTCPMDITTVPADWAAQRIINLMGAWRDQLLEVMGAMGIREIRRLRGEVGRAMFFEQLEKEVFAPLFAPAENGEAAR